jgi:transposase
MHLVYLLSYSPDLNPIEESFSTIKSWLRGYRDYVMGKMEGYTNDPYALIWEAIYTAVGTAEKVYGWYWHSKYIA